MSFSTLLFSAFMEPSVGLLKDLESAESHEDDKTHGRAAGGALWFATGSTHVAPCVGKWRPKLALPHHSDGQCGLNSSRNSPSRTANVTDLSDEDLASSSSSSSDEDEVSFGLRPPRRVGAASRAASRRARKDKNRPAVRPTTAQSAGDREDKNMLTNANPCRRRGSAFETDATAVASTEVNAAVGSAASAVSTATERAVRAAGLSAHTRSRLLACR